MLFRQWVPERRELLAQVIIGVALIVINIIPNIIAGRSFSFILLTTLGVVLLVMAISAVYEYHRQPYRRRTLQGKELIDAVDTWLREDDYARGPIQLEGYSHAIEVSGSRLNAKTWIAIEDKMNALLFLSNRTDIADAMSLMPAEQVTKLKVDLSLEIARMGGYFLSEDNPYTITFFDRLPIDENVNKSKVVDRLWFIQRLDFLVNSVYLRQTLEVNSTPSPAVAESTPTPSPESTSDTAPPQPESVP